MSGFEEILPLIKEAMLAAEARGDKVRAEDIMPSPEALRMWREAPRRPFPAEDEVIRNAVATHVDRRKAFSVKATYDANTDPVPKLAYRHGEAFPSDGTTCCSNDGNPNGHSRACVNFKSHHTPPVPTPVADTPAAMLGEAVKLANKTEALAFEVFHSPAGPTVADDVQSSRVLLTEAVKALSRALREVEGRDTTPKVGQD